MWNLTNKIPHLIFSAQWSNIMPPTPLPLSSLLPQCLPEMEVAGSSPTTPGPGPNLNLGSPLHTSRPRHWMTLGQRPWGGGPAPPRPWVGAREERYLGRLRDTRARSNIFQQMQHCHVAMGVCLVWFTMFLQRFNTLSNFLANHILQDGLQSVGHNFTLEQAQSLQSPGLWAHRSSHRWMSF